MLEKKYCFCKSKLFKIDKAMNSNKGDKHILNCKKGDLQGELEIKLRFQVRACQIRSKSQYVEEGEKILYIFKFGKATTNK